MVEVIKGGPLDKAGMNVAAGSIIQAIDGETIAPIGIRRNTSTVARANDAPDDRGSGRRDRISS